jgi:hypothetical protein
MNTESFEVVSERCGEPGSVFVAGEGVNVDALLNGGFIKKLSRQPKKAVTETEENPEKE